MSVLLVNDAVLIVGEIAQLERNLPEPLPVSKKCIQRLLKKNPHAELTMRRAALKEKERAQGVTIDVIKEFASKLKDAMERLKINSADQIVTFDETGWGGPQKGAGWVISDKMYSRGNEILPVMDTQHISLLHACTASGDVLPPVISHSTILANGPHGR